jgi:hypothetical protein
MGVVEAWSPGGGAVSRRREFGRQGAKTVEDTFSILAGRLYDKGMPRGPIHVLVGEGWGQIAIKVVVHAARLGCTLRWQSLSGEERENSFEIDVDWEPCRLGGMRPYLWCPGRCGKRAQRLFLDGDMLVCRRCAGLLYASQVKPLYRRQLDEAARIREMFGGSTRPGSPFGRKPAYMRWRKYEEMKARALDLEAAGWEVVLARAESSLSVARALVERLEAKVASRRKQ